MAEQNNAARLRAKSGVAAFPDAQWRQIADAGWFRILVDEQHGGLGLGVRELGAVFRAAGAGLVRGPLLEHAVGLAVLANGAGPAWSDLLGQALDGQRLIVFAETLDALAGTTGSLRYHDGLLDGVAELVPFGQYADDLLVVAVHAGRLLLLRVDAARPRRLPCRSVDPCAEYCRLEFEGLLVPATDIVLADAEALLASIEDTRRLMMAAELSGAVDCLVDMAVEYARMRKQFGRPIGSFQALQHMLAELAARGGALRHLVAATLDDVAADPARLHELAIIAKAYACTTGRYAAEESLQVHGGIGFTNDLPLHLYYRRVLTHQGFLGESDALMCELGRLMLASALTATTEGT